MGSVAVETSPPDFFCNWLENSESETNEFSLAVAIRRVVRLLAPERSGGMRPAERRISHYIGKIMLYSIHAFPLS